MEILSGVRPRLFFVIIVVLVLSDLQKVASQSCRFGTGCQYACNCATGTCDPQSGVCTGGCARGWDGPNCQRQNVALNRPTFQNNSYCEGTFCYESRYAVDGRATTWLSRNCSHVGSGADFWNVTLDKPYSVYRFQIYNRIDGQCGGDKKTGRIIKCGTRLNGFTLAVGNSSQNYQTCYQDNTTSEDGPGGVINGTCNNGGPIVGDTVRISAKQPGVLTLCEVYIYVCSAGWYGKMCARECVTKSACKRCGVNGLECEECVPRRWGKHCIRKCGHCRLNTDCDRVYGDCPEVDGKPRCEAGYRGVSCKKNCTVGNYGPDCRENCGFCADGPTVCNITSGYCPDRPGLSNCMPGYTDERCKTECDDGRWGEECANHCGHCYNESACEKSLGKCPPSTPLCAAGFTSQLCNITCSVGKWGPDCNQSCHGDCVDNLCDGTNGKCTGGCRPGGKGDHCVSEPISNPVKIGDIIGAVIGIIAVVVVVVVLVVLYRRRRQAASRRREDGSPTGNDIPIPAIETQGNAGFVMDDPDAEEVEQSDAEPYQNCGILPPAIPVSEFADYVMDKQASGDFKVDFKKLPTGLLATHDAADLPENKCKSRYKSIVAYDHSRVILRELEGVDQSDYINANYINGYNAPKKFIASQGPTDIIVGDFMRMIWEQDCGKVVMVTNLTEGTRCKCYQYWPNKGSEQFGVINVTLLDEECFPNYIIRTLNLTHGRVQSRTIKQFHFTSWPDHGTPSHADGLQEFREKVQSYETPLTGPIVVHCSAGIGRTGTFIALDYLICQAKAEGVVDVSGCVCLLREDRVNMVQTQEQYEFIHEAVVEALQLNGSCVPSDEFSRVYDELCFVNRAKGKTKMEEQFQSLNDVTSSVDKSTTKAALNPENRFKNRNIQILAADNCRPFLSTPVKGHNDYINAVYLPGYRRKRAFIITQTPLPDTVVDFWRLVYDHGVRTIVMLDRVQPTDETVGIYWPETAGEYGPFWVKVTDKDDRPGAYLWTYQLTYRNTITAPLIKQYRCKFWSGSPSPESIPRLLKVLQDVQQWQEQSGNESILVHCRNGLTESGLYCAASSEIDRLKAVQEVNILQTIKQMRRNRSQIVTDLNQFHLLHQIVMGYLETVHTYANFSETR